jgi:photosystem II stability/assembly factor-like uncharacterized protein
MSFQNGTIGGINLTGSFREVSLSGSNGIGGSTADGLYYTTNFGETWLQSNIITGYYSRVSLSGSKGIAANISGGLYYTEDSGINWTISNISSGLFYNI